MSEQPTGTGEEKKTVAIRVSPELRGRLDSVLQITELSVNDAGIEALTDWIAKQLSDPEIRAKALASLDNEERALKARREVLQGLMGEDSSPQKPAGSRRGGKSS
ncbi:hypothetical protein ETD83_29545 [Actinomadura soli]|uniref:Uncharacterized protein n=1 Tax=Actinomadura soli TaxID=2508997 RepID=A0A5C4J5D8_9ACTN|nr:hypothetical protein [Actinomadura soli]TMQ91748.1 hypothetical protein ETD83_29545 [Actinomadura soli]